MFKEWYLDKSLCFWNNYIISLKVGQVTSYLLLQIFFIVLLITFILSEELEDYDTSREASPYCYNLAHIYVI